MTGLARLMRIVPAAMLDLHAPETLWYALVRLLAAAGCGAVVGFDREWMNKPAGLRTHMLVAVGSAAFALLALSVFDGLNGSGEHTRLDPLRLIEGIIGGVGFLGAGAILQSRGTVQGLTTAAGIWVVGAIGLASGLGLLGLAGLTTATSFCILAPLGWIERAARKQDRKESA